MTNDVLLIGQNVSKTSGIIEEQQSIETFFDLLDVKFEAAPNANGVVRILRPDGFFFEFSFSASSVSKEFLQLSNAAIAKAREIHRSQVYQAALESGSIASFLPGIKNKFWKSENSSIDFFRRLVCRSSISEADSAPMQNIQNSETKNFDYDESNHVLLQCATFKKQQGDWAWSQIKIKHALQLIQAIDDYSVQTEYGRAIESVSQARLAIANIALNNDISEQLYSLLNQKIESLYNYVCFEINNSIYSKSRLIVQIQRLIKLGLYERARTVFLSSRDELIRSKCNGIHFEGNIVQFINEYALVTFSILRNTCEIFTTIFTELEYSHLVSWADYTLLNYVNKLRKHLFFSQSFSFSHICESVRITKKHVQTLKTVGMDLSPFLENYLVPDLLDLIKRYDADVNTKIASFVDQEEYQASFDQIESLLKSFCVDEVSTILVDQLFSNVCMSQLSCLTYKTMQDFINDMCAVLPNELLDFLVDCVVRQAECFCTAFTQKELKGHHLRPVLNDATIFKTVIFPAFETQLQSRLDRPLERMHAFKEARLNTFVEKDIKPKVSQNLLPLTLSELMGPAAYGKQRISPADVTDIYLPFQ